MSDEIKRHIKEKLALVPEKPGSYQMKNKDGIIIYVGKAKNLRRRLKSYFNRTVTGKTLMLVNDIVDFEYIVTNSELSWVQYSCQKFFPLLYKNQILKNKIKIFSAREKYENKFLNNNNRQRN